MYIRNECLVLIVAGKYAQHRQSKNRLHFKARLTNQERYNYEKMEALKLPDKNKLWDLIKKANNDGITIYYDSLDHLDVLFNQQLIAINNLYKGKGHSLIVLPHAQTLIRKIKSSVS